MSRSHYTLASWHVAEGQEGEFLQVWANELAPHFLSIDPTTQGTLIQSLEDPQQFYSFGPWESLEKMQAARTNERTRELLAKLTSLCDTAKPGAFKVVLTLP